jgi:hypothetical protein
VVLPSPSNDDAYTAGVLLWLPDGPAIDDDAPWEVAGDVCVFFCHSSLVVGSGFGAFVTKPMVVDYTRAVI